MEELISEEDERSPRTGNKVKFLCSHGGKILPRPSDGQLKYVGGETKLIAVPADITFSEIMNKMNSLFNSGGILKYQLIPGDVDSLIMVTCDEDLRNMFSEFYLHDGTRLRDGRSAKMRAFLFPCTPPITTTKDAHISNTDGDPVEDLKQRYIKAINSIMRTTSDLGPSTAYSAFSPGSPLNSSDSVGDAPVARYLGRYNQELQRVQSSPNLLNSGHQQHCHHQPYHQLRPRRPGTPPMTSQSDVARYNVDQLARRYRTPLFHRREGRECNGFGQPNGLIINRSGEIVDGELHPRRHVKRWGSPLRHSSNRQD